MENNTIEKPKHFLILKVIGFVGVIVAVVGCILLVVGISASIHVGSFDSFEANARASFTNFTTGSMLLFLGLGVGIPCLVCGFAPEIKKMMIKTGKYIQKQNQEDLTDIANTTGDIASSLVTKTASAIKTGLKDTVYCKYCGGEIDRDSTFCKHCGKSQN